ncbi:MAG: hypothetical protein ORN51_10255 [Akkermansiaceae bacterium]|nr:hypothetical protein [Akkermansiaceae bacterium]
MQNYCKTIGALAAVSALVAGIAQAEVEYTLHTGYSNEYLFRGVNQGNNLIETGLDAATEVNGIALSAGAWYANYQAPRSLAGPSVTHNANELDLYVSASKDLGFATASLGYIYYQNSFDQLTEGSLGKAADAQEVSIGLSRDLGFANASLTYFGQIEGDSNGYSELALTRGIELSPCLNLNLAANLGYLADKGQATALTLKASLDYGFAEHAKLSPFIAQSFSLSDDRDTVYFGSENETVVGSMISVGF